MVHGTPGNDRRHIRRLSGIGTWLRAGTGRPVPRPKRRSSPRRPETGWQSDTGHVGMAGTRIEPGMARPPPCLQRDLEAAGPQRKRLIGPQRRQVRPRIVDAASLRSVAISNARCRGRPSRERRRRDAVLCGSGRPNRPFGAAVRARPDATTHGPRSSPTRRLSTDRCHPDSEASESGQLLSVVETGRATGKEAV